MCTTIQTGMAFARSITHDAAGTHQVLLGRHIQSGQSYRFRPEDLCLVIPERIPTAYCAHPGDIVVVARGSQNMATLLGELAPGPPTIVSSSFFLIRTRPEIHPRFLAWYLNQPPAQQFIASARTSTSSPILQKTRLMDLPIPVPPLARQQEMLPRIALMETEADLRRRALATTIELHAALSRRLLAQITHAEATRETDHV